MCPGAHGDVADLTGAHTKRRQIQNLARNGIPHTINAAGWPVVMWSAVDGSAKCPPEGDGGWSSNALRSAA
ncbi:DUF4224 domain-containing protein [Stenotrophomonas maltophilia]|uniref:DUF4224 domain-containing protein n=1 Tax=Stenotrophomonas indicatrix TaxID=2045451 RepID=UPI001122A7BC|nr:DUF4224 domain-containing protein [Stenotrophomonas maltophilia]